jgi:MarR family transcriptional regulator, 2-MHQ and catechol-resistance regulon repressor
MQRLVGAEGGGGLELPRFEDASLSSDAAELGDGIERLLRSQRLRSGKQTCSWGITLTECYTLEALVRQPGRTVTQIARTLALDKSTASRVLRSLQKKGLARKRTHGADMRAVRVDASLRGARLYDQIRRADLECHRRLLASFSPETRRAVVAVIQALTCREVPAERRTARVG